MVDIMVRSNAERAQHTVVLFWLLTPVLVLFSGINLLYSGQSAFDTNEAVGWLQSFLAVALIALTLAAAIYFLSWFRRAYANLRRAGFRPEHSDGWAVGAWFVPILNLFRPYSMMREIWLDTHRLAYGTQPPRRLLSWWWTFFVISSILGRISNTLGKQEETAQQLENAAVADVLHTIFIVAFLLLTITVIKQLADAEEQLLLRQQVDNIGGPAPEPVDLGATEEEHYY